MSSTSTVCQGLQSCLDPLLQEPRILTHHFVPSKQHLPSPWLHNETPIPQPEIPKFSPFEKVYESNRTCENSWNLIKPCTKLTNDPVQQVYVHPRDTRSICSLSSRSLEMCTESLVSETGSGIDLNINEFPLKKQSCCMITKLKTRKVKQGSSFPPPLTSNSGSQSVQVQTHREGGRLVIKAFSFTSSSSIFRAERENGRLRLSLVKTENEQEEEEEADYEVKAEAVKKTEADGVGLYMEMWSGEVSGAIS